MKKSLIFCLLVVFIGLNLGLSSVSLAQTNVQTKKKRSVKKKKVAPARAEFKISEGGIGTGSSSLSFGEIPKYLSLEPCGKETPAQIAEIENAPEAARQVDILARRLTDKDEWTRGCAIYRLGEFQKLSAPALPYLIKMLRDDRTDGIFNIALSAIYKIRPADYLNQKDWLKMTEDTDVYIRLYGIWALGFYTPVPGTSDLKERVTALIKATKDEDITVSWMAVRGIQRLGLHAHDAVPALVDVIQSKKINPREAMTALGRMGPYAWPAIPVLFDVLYHSEKYVGNSDQAYMIYLTAATSLSDMGKDLIPVLEKEFDQHPAAILEVAENMDEIGVPILIRGLKHPNNEIRQKVLEGFFTDDKVLFQLFPYIVKSLDDVDPEVRKEAAGKIGTIASSKKYHSPELSTLLKEQGLPALIISLRDKDKTVVCFSAFSIGDFGADGESAIPVLVKMIKLGSAYPNNCANSALFDIGEKGRAFISKENLKKIEQDKKLEKENGLDDLFLDKKVKPISPKLKPKTASTPEGY